MVLYSRGVRLKTGLVRPEKRYHEDKEGWDAFWKAQGYWYSKANARVRAAQFDRQYELVSVVIEVKS